MSILLFVDADKNPLGKYLNFKKLNFSVNSLKEVDGYLEKIRKNKERLSEEKIKKIILRCGTYLGEVIRKVSIKEFDWISYDEAKKINKNLEYDVIKDITTHILIYDLEKEIFWFPLSKVYKFLEHGKGDNLWSFAMVCLEEHNR